MTQMKWMKQRKPRRKLLWRGVFVFGMEKNILLNRSNRSSFFFNVPSAKTENNITIHKAY